MIPLIQTQRLPPIFKCLQHYQCRILCGTYRSGWMSMKCVWLSFSRTEFPSYYRHVINRHAINSVFINNNPQFSLTVIKWFNPNQTTFIAYLAQPHSFQNLLQLLFQNIVDILQCNKVLHHCLLHFLSFSVGLVRHHCSWQAEYVFALLFSSTWTIFCK